MIVTFCGHKDVVSTIAVSEWVYNVTEQLILDGATVSYLGGFGDFDSIAKSIMMNHKKRYPQIEIVLILAYLNRSFDSTGYSYTLYPPLETVPMRYAIVKRNEWMVNESDLVVAYITHGWGGAAKTYEYAKRKHKQIVLYSSDSETK